MEPELRATGTVDQVYLNIEAISNGHLVRANNYQNGEKNIQETFFYEDEDKALEKFCELYKRFKNV